MVKLGDDCPQCGRGLRVEQTRRLLDGRYRQRWLVCRDCDFRDSEVVPIDSRGRPSIAGNTKVVVCPCCDRTMEILVDETGEIHITHEVEK